MSATNFILEYGGCPVEFDFGAHLVRGEFATRFASESAAWQEARNEGLNIHRCRVVNLYLRSQPQQLD